MPMQRAQKKPVIIEFWEWDGTEEVAMEIIEWVRSYGVTCDYVYPGHFHQLRRHYPAERAQTEDKKTVTSPDAPGFIAIHTLEGDHRADPGDRIIRGVQRPPLPADFYPCKPVAFGDTYQIVDDNG